MQLSLFRRRVTWRLWPVFWLCFFSQGLSAQSPLLNPLDFSKRLAQDLEQQLGLERAIKTTTLNLTLYDAQAHKHVFFLSELYLSYLNRGADLGTLSQQLLQRYRHHEQHWPQLQQIFPLLRSKTWLQQQQKKYPKLYFQALNNDLYKVFSFKDSAELLDQSELQALQLEPATLDHFAMANLKRAFLAHGDLAAIDTRNEEKVYLYKLDDEFDAAGLLLLNELQPKLDVPGELVAFVPSRGVLLLVGSQAPQAMALAKRLAQQAYANFDDAISPYGYQFKQMQWQRYRDVSHELLSGS